MFTALGTGGVTEGLPQLCTAVGCVALGEIVRALMLTGSAAFAVAVLALLGNVRGATAACRDEHRRLEEEERAFRQFARRVNDLDPTSLQPRTDGGHLVDRGRRSTEDDSTAAVRTAYRETVMDIDHYESHYGESLETNMREEFGPDVAAVVTAGATFTPELKQTLVAKAHTRADHRASVRTTLDHEIEALTRARERLSSIRDELERVRSEPRFTSFPSLADRWRRLRRLETDCADLLEDRQANLREQDDSELREYVYTDLDVRHPVLADLAAAIELVRSERQDVEWMLARTV